MLEKLNSTGGEMEISVDVNSVCCVVARTYILYLLLLDIVIGGLFVVMCFELNRKSVEMKRHMVSHSGGSRLC